MIKFLDLHGQYLGIKEDIDAAMEAVIRDSAFIGGAHVAQFEGRFAAYQQSEHCVGVGNATDGLEIALEVLGLPPGSEVIVPANSFIASSEAVSRAGYQVVFADIDPDTYTLDPVDVERRITTRTAAILVVHLYGHPCDMNALGLIAREHGLRIVEDCAQAHGAEYEGQRVGTLGDVGVFSFYPGKVLGGYGDGGAIVTNDAVLANKCRMSANHGRKDKYDHEFEGRNSRLDGLQAAILDVKLKYLDSWIDHRNRVAQNYLEGLRGIPGITLPVVRPHVRHAYHLFVIRTQHRDPLARHLRDNHIQTGVHYPIALPKLKAYAHLGQATEGFLANQIDDELLSLPIGEHLDLEQAALVCQAVRRFAG